MLKNTAFILLTLIAAASASCRKTSIPQEEATVGISFNASVENNQTGLQAKSIVEDVDGMESFTIWGWYSPQDVNSTVFDRVRVDNDGGLWSYGEPRYWLRGRTYDFFAVYPDAGTLEQSGAGVACTEDGAVTVRDFDARFGHDLMTACSLDMSGDNPRPVPLDFSHMLTCVSFYVQRGSLWEADDIVTLEAASLSPVSVKGTLGYDAVSGQASWSDTAAEGFTMDSPVELASGSGGEYIFRREGNGSLFLLPQDIGAVRISVTYSSRKYAEQMRSASLTTTTIVRWEAGRRYTYTLTLQPDMIVFSGLQADRWGETSTGGGITVQ